YAATGVALVLVAGLAGCGANSPGDGSGDGGAKGGTLTILTASSEIDLHAIKSQGLAITSLALVARRLTTWDIQPGKPASVVPDLATDTGKSADAGRTWTFTLKDGL